jgi:predicted metalloprotease
VCRSVRSALQLRRRRGVCADRVGGVGVGVGVVVVVLVVVAVVAAVAAVAGTQRIIGGRRPVQRCRQDSHACTRCPAHGRVD